jgi:hypothetical protein
MAPVFLAGAPAADGSVPAAGHRPQARQLHEDASRFENP